MDREQREGRELREKKRRVINEEGAQDTRRPYKRMRQMRYSLVEEDWGQEEECDEQEEHMDRTNVDVIRYTTLPATKPSANTDYFLPMRIQDRYKMMDQSWAGDKEEDDSFLEMVTCVEQNNLTITEQDEERAPSTMAPPGSKVNVLGGASTTPPPDLGIAMKTKTGWREEQVTWGELNQSTTAPPVVGNKEEGIGGDITTPLPDQEGCVETMTVWEEDNWASKDDSLERILGEDQSLASQEQGRDTPENNLGVPAGVCGEEEDDWGGSSEEDDLLEMSAPYMGAVSILHTPSVPPHHTPQILRYRDLQGIIRSVEDNVGTSGHGIDNDHGGSKTTPCGKESMMIPLWGSTA